MSNTPIIVGGFYRSGTTLLRRLLDSHSRIHCGPEVKFFKDFYGDYIADPLAHMRFFSTARSYQLPESTLLKLFGRGFIEFHVEATRAASKTRWADKNPENVLYIEQWQTLLPEGFTFVHVVRNPLDALASLVEIGFPKTMPPQFVDKVKMYKQFREAGAAYCSTHPESSIEISYEDLVAAPYSTLEALMRKLGEAYEPSMLSGFYSAERGSGIEDPKAAMHTSIHASSIGRGRRDLSAPEIEVAQQYLADYL